MSRLSRWLLVLVLGGGLVSVSLADKLKIATEAFYEPFAYKAADGTLVGFDIDITYALCDVMGACLLYTSPSPRDRGCSRMPSSA